MSGRVILLTLTLGLCGLITACASYRFGTHGRSLPGGYKSVAIPIFTNRSQEVGFEMEFTNALIRAVERAKVASVARSGEAPVRLEGTIVKVKMTANTISQSGEIKALPDRAVLITGYRLEVDTELKLVRPSDGSVIWQGAFRGEKTYAAPRIGAPVLNSANVLYNQSAQKINLADLANNLMEEAHDRMTENF